MSTVIHATVQTNRETLEDIGGFQSCRDRVTAAMNTTAEEHAHVLDPETVLLESTEAFGFSSGEFVRGAEVPALPEVAPHPVDEDDTGAIILGLTLTYSGVVHPLAEVPDELIQRLTAKSGTPTT